MASPYRAEELCHQIKIQHRTTSLDAYGDTVESWTDLGTYWAFVRPASARESVIANQLKAEVYHVITMRWQGESTVISPQMRVIFRGEVLNIVTVSNRDNRNWFYDITATQVVT